MKSAAEVWEVVAGLAVARANEKVARRHACGRVLAAAVSASCDVPGLDVSAMDGYAVGPAARPGSPIVVVGTVAAGDRPGLALEAEQAARIMTGAAVPRGANRVVPVELTDGGLDRVVFDRDLPAGANIRPRGEVVRAGDRLLEAGTHLGPVALSWLASHGVAEVEVVGQPTVAFATTGDEVVAPERQPEPGQLRDSHSDFLASSLRRLGIEPRVLGIVPDRREALEAAVERGLAADVLILCGGVSAGAFDFVEPTLVAAGCRILVDAVSLQPGKPLVVARGPAGQVVFGLPGNPASVFVTFRLFVQPLLRSLAGHADGLWWGAAAAVLGAATPTAAGRERVVGVRLEHRTGEPAVAWPLAPRGSHDLAALATADALVRIAPNTRVEAGQVVSALPL
jgi:molybdopterin molybdotransferase